MYLANHASGPPRVELAAFSYEGTLLLHLLLGVLSVGWFVTRIGAIARMCREKRGALAITGALTFLCLAVCLVTGLLFLGIGANILSLRLRPGLRIAHDIGTSGMVVFGFAYLVLKARQAVAARKAAGEDDTHAFAPEIAHARLAKRLALVLGIPFFALLAYTLQVGKADRVVINPALPVLTAFDEGDGKDGKFFPASVQSVGNQFFPSEYFMDSKGCGAKGCHEDIYNQWNSSAHHIASFNNQWYRKSVEYTQEVAGVKASKWCGGCHDMAVLLTEDPKNAGHSRFDTPIAAHDFPAEKYPESHSGIGCAACHSVVHVKSTSGNADYTSDYPPMHKYLTTDNALMKGVHNFLTRLAPEPHKKTFLRPFHVESTAKFCSSCHKVHLDVPVNNYRWLRGQDEYDAWQGSGVSGFGAASFYYPMDEKTGQPAFKKCADCHMPTTPSNDPGNINGIVHNHRFPGANTALPTAYHDAKQLEVTQKFLSDKAVTIDLFAIRREKAGAVVKVQNPKNQVSTRTDTPRAASMNGDTNAANIPTQASNVSSVEEDITAPLNRGGVGAVLRRGEKPLLDVVVRTRKLGHAFPGGTIDAQEVWVELEAKDDKGRTFYHSGKLSWPDGPLEESAERYRALQIDGHSNAINKRNPWAVRAVVYAKTIGPGAADVVHFRLPVPKNCGNSVTLTAKLNYRKFTWWNNQFMYAGRTAGVPKTAKAYSASGKLVNVSDSNTPHIDAAGRPVPVGLGLGKTSGPVTHAWDDRPVTFDNDLSIVSGPTKAVPVLPITVMAQDSITLPVVDAKAPLVAPAIPMDVKKDRERWNDYGIGLLLQGDFLHATGAFEQVTKVAPQWPEGWVNIGRVRQAERDSRAAMSAFEKAFKLYDAKPDAMTPYRKSRAQFFYAQSQFDQGKLDDALSTLTQVMDVFPDDRNVRNLSGQILFRLGRYDDAIAQLKHTLSIDPEDIVAHYNLMKCYRGKGDLQTASIHDKLYRRFKADENNTNLVGEYTRKHPIDNMLAQPIHEHGDAVLTPMPDWVRRQMQPVPPATKINVAQKGKPARKPVTINKPANNGKRRDVALAR